MELHAQMACSMPRELASRGVSWQSRAVYSEAVLYCRENLRDGKVLRGDLMFWMPDMPVRARTAHLDKLADQGALQRIPDGWQIPEHVWRKWGRMKADVEAQREMASEAGVRGNHERWHIGPEGTPSPKCPLCRRDHVGLPDRDAIGSLSPKPEPEPEPQTKPEAAAAAAAAPDALLPAAAAALDIYVAHRLHTEDGIKSPRVYAKSIRDDETFQNAALLNDLAQQDLTPKKIAVRVFGLTEMQIARTPKVAS